MNYTLVGKAPVPSRKPKIQSLWRNHVGRILVSTVFLGIDHSFTGGTPVLFETMVFGGALDGYQERYTSYEAARERHREILARVLSRTSIWRRLLYWFYCSIGSRKEG